MVIIDSDAWGLLRPIQLDDGEFVVVKDGYEITRGTADYCKGYIDGYDKGYSIPTCDFDDQ